VQFSETDQAAQIFSYLPIERQEELLKAMAHEEVVNILNAMSDDDRTDLLEELPANVTQQLLNSLSPSERQLAVQFLGYAENTVGRLMTPHFVRDGCSRAGPEEGIQHEVIFIRSDLQNALNQALGFGGGKQFLNGRLWK
jgi:hypothetical protein